MSFNSLEFFLFFPVVTALFFWVAPRHQVPLLLAASCFFYVYEHTQHFFLVLYSALLSYVGALALARMEGKSRRWLLAVLIGGALWPLLYYKYWNFAAQNLNPLLLAWGYAKMELREGALPVGISFFTFQVIGYLVEVSTGRFTAEANFQRFFLFKLFYPQLVAGPIEKPQNLLPQLKESHSFVYRRVTDGLRLMAWGFFKKVVISDELAMYTARIFEQPENYGAPALLMAAVFYSFRIYCDFSGYTDIGKGVARVMGIELVRNFDSPYLSRSVAEFWNRWHISLFHWFRDYVYIPLGGSRAGRAKFYRNIMIVFLLSGLWHGANWTFVIWGALNGFYMVASHFTKDSQARFKKAIGLSDWPLLERWLDVGVTFSFITFAWIFFKAKDLGQAILFIRRLFTEWGYAGKLFSREGMAISGQSFLYCVFLICVLLLLDRMPVRDRIRSWVASRKLPLRWAVYYAVVAWIMISFMRYRATPPTFIYFQF